MRESHYRDELADQPLDFTIEAEERLADGFRPLDRYTLRHAALGGGTIGPISREILSTGSVVVIIPYDRKLDAIIVVRQFRIGAALRTPNAAALELPAGLVDAGERPEEAAARELLEETGLAPLAMERCFSLLSSPGLTDEHAVVFLALVDASRLASAAGKAEEHEDIRPIVAKVDDLVEAVDDGWVENGFLVGCTHWFDRKGRARALALSGSIDIEDQEP